MMKLTRSEIYLDNLRFKAFHGVLEQERVVGNDYVVSLRVGYDVGRALHTDDVAHTLNYAALYRLVAEEMARPASLLERVAGRIGQRLFEEFPQAETAEIDLRKLNPPMGADCDGAGVVLHLINDKT